MASLSVTAANCISVAGVSTNVFEVGVAGAALTAGMALYIDTANSNVMKGADADLSSIGATFAGIALHAAGTGQPIRYQTAGDITLGATLVAGQFYVVGITTGGDIAPITDVSTSWRASLIGYATTTAILRIIKINTDIVR